MRKLFLSISAIFGAIPGLATMVLGIGVPPGYKYLFGGLIQAIGALSILILRTNRARIKKLSSQRVSTVATALIGTCILMIVVYLALLHWCVVTHHAHGTVYYPLWSSGRLLELVNRTGGRWAALDRYGKTPIYNAVAQTPPYVLAFTTILLLFVYQLIFTSLTLAFGLLAFRERKS